MDIQRQLDSIVAPAAIIFPNPDDYPGLVDTLRNFGELYDMATEAERKELFALMFERIYVYKREIAAIQPTAAIYPLLVSSCGPDGIRTRALGLDRAAC